MRTKAPLFALLVAIAWALAESAWSQAGATPASPASSAEPSTAANSPSSAASQAGPSSKQSAVPRPFYSCEINGKRISSDRPIPECQFSNGGRKCLGECAEKFNGQRHGGAGS